jgi:drug/metabolite transporter (DMT)-like permease
MRPSQLISFCVLAVIWGTTWLAIKLVVVEMPPLTAAGIRFGTAAVLLAVYARLRGRRLAWSAMAPADRRLLLVLSLLMFSVPYGLVFFGEQYIESALTSILFSIAPAFTLVFDSWRSQRNLATGERLAGLLLAFSGILFIFIPRLAGPPAELWGCMAIIAAAASSSWAMVLAKHRANHLDTLVSTTWQMGLGAVWLLLAGLPLERPLLSGASLQAWLALFYLAAFGSCITFVLFYELLKQMAAVQLSSLAFITPVVAVFVGWLVLDEVLGPAALAGAVVVLVGVALIHRPVAAPAPAGD